jgi:diguanylate cyclase
VELRQANARLAQLVGEDALTGLDNRRRGFERLAELLSWRQRMPGSDCVVLMDLDHFKRINDRHGHLGGDAVLRAVGHLLRTQLRAIDIAARYGGEELLLVLVDADVAQGRHTIDRLAEALRQMAVVYDGQPINVDASFGLAVSDPSQSIEQWLARADAALYRAKRHGRGRLCVDGHDD